MFHAVLPPIIRVHQTVHVASGIVKPILLPAAIMDEMDRQLVKKALVLCIHVKNVVSIYARFVYIC
jgi:hypothetical protein